MRMIGSILIAIALTSCCQKNALLRCRSEFLFPTYLASVQVETPDPMQDCFYGQQIILRWNLSKKSFPSSSLHLNLEVRYGTRAIETFEKEVCGKKGYAIFRLLNQDYWQSEGVISYRAVLFDEENLIAECRHPLWSELIVIGEN